MKNIGQELAGGSVNGIGDLWRTVIFVIRTSASSTEQGGGGWHPYSASEALRRDVTEASNDASNRRRIVQTNRPAIQHPIRLASIFQPAFFVVGAFICASFAPRTFSMRHGSRSNTLPDIQYINFWQESYVFDLISRFDQRLELTGTHRNCMQGTYEIIDYRMLSSYTGAK